MAGITLQSLSWCFVLLCTCSGTEQIGAANRPLRTVDVVAADVLRAAKVPGGIEVITGCNQFVASSFDVTSGLVDNTLASLSRSDPSLSWYKRGNRYTVTIKGVSAPSLTSAKLPALKMKVKTLSEATDLLLQQKGTQDRIAELKLVGAPDELGFSSIHERDVRQISLPAGTLQDDLNALAAAFGAAVWHLDQRQCGGSRTFRLSWIAK